MSKRFAVMVSGTINDDVIITRHLMSKGWGIWHYLTNAWLLSSVPDTLTPKTLYEEFASLPGISPVRMVVIEISDNPKYWGIGDKAGWEWMDRNFGSSG